MPFALLRTAGLRTVGLLCAGLLLVGCATSSIPRPAIPGDAPIELTTTPFFPQRDFHCGPAAMAAVLGAAGIPVAPDQLAPLLYVPDRRGSFQVELAALPRRYDRMAVAIAGSLDAIVAQLLHGRPVLVLQNLAVEQWPRWHYAVVVGYLPEQDRFVLRSGDERRMLMSRHRFLASWIRAGRWGMVVLPPDAPPRGLEASAYLQAAAALETTGRHASALAAFESALAVWPDDPTAGLGRANNLYQLGRRPEAEDAYRAVLRRVPEHPVALHNLAMLLVETGQSCAALAVLPPAAPDEPALLGDARRAALDRIGTARSAAGPLPGEVCR